MTPASSVDANARIPCGQTIAAPELGVMHPPCSKTDNHQAEARFGARRVPVRSIRSRQVIKHAGPAAVRGALARSGTRAGKLNCLLAAGGWPARVLLATARPGYARLERLAFGLPGLPG